MTSKNDHKCLLVWLAGHLPVIGIAVTAADAAADSTALTWGVIAGDWWLGEKWPLAALAVAGAYGAAGAIVGWLFRKATVLSLPPGIVWAADRRGVSVLASGEAAAYGRVEPPGNGRIGSRSAERLPRFTATSHGEIDHYRPAQPA